MKLNDFRLSTRIMGGMMLLVSLGALSWILADQAGLQQEYLRKRSSDLEAALHAERMRLEQSITTLRQETIFLANTPPVSGIMRAAANRGIDPRDRNNYEMWEKRLQEIFSAFLRARPDYFQVRYIGVADGGRELVRVDSREGRIEVMPRDRLQAKGDRDYFKAGLALPLGRVYLSEFNLNQEYGKVEQPQRPTLRAVSPVYDTDGRIFGMVVINQDVRHLFQSARSGLPAGVETFIANRHGDYLLHPDGRRSFAFDLGGRSRIGDDFPSLAPLFDAQRPGYLPLHGVNGAEGGGYLAAERIYFDGGDPSRFLLLAYRIPPEVAGAEMGSLQWRRLALFLLVVMLLGAGLFEMLRRSFLPLKRITQAARMIAAGDTQLRLPRDAGGEIGELSDALNVMLDRLSERDFIEKEGAYRKQMIEALPGIFYMLDREGRFLMWNRNLPAEVQRSDAELAACHPLDFFEGADRERIARALREVFEQGETALDAELVARDGTRKPYHFTGRRILREGEPVLVGLGLDVTELHQSLRMVEGLLRRNQALMMSSMEGIHVMDVDGNVLDVNDAFCAMLGYTREEALRLNVRDWDDQFSAEELRQRLQAFIGASGTFDTVHRRKDGSLLDVEICATGVEIDGKGYVFASGRDITTRKQMQEVLLRHHNVVETAMDGYWMTSADGFLEEANAAYAQMSGYTQQELVGMHISQLEAREQPEDVRGHIDKIIAQGSDRFESRHRRKDGLEFDLEVAVTYDADNRKFFVFCHDISQRKRAEEQLRIAAAAFETRDAILITDAQSNIIRVNKAFSEITGYQAGEVLGLNPRIMSSGRHDKAFYAEMWRQLLETGSWSGEMWDRRKSGEIYPKWLTITAVKNERGETTQYVAIFSDITERKQAEEEIRNLAFYDALTRLPNRRLFLERFNSALLASARHMDFGAILFLDLDRFKVLNDTLGHDHGDLLLVEVAQRIAQCVREMDTVARLGGDEFVVLLEGLAFDRDEASHKAGLVAEKIREALSRPYLLKGHEHFSSPSIGINLFHGDHEPVEVLLKHADVAMYQAKSAGRDAARFYDPALQHAIEIRAALEHDLRHAIERNELQLLYQVQVDRELRPVGVEGLLRWNHPQRGIVLPTRFIPVAEDSSLILEIGGWVLETACRQLAAWGDDAAMRHLTLAINVSAHQFRAHNFVEQVADALARHRVDPARLEIELTESVVLHDVEDIIAKMMELKKLGVLLSLDDFGTGYASLAYLKRLPLDQIKIDQSFIRDLTVDASDAVIVQTIIDMARNFKRDVVAEGVETEAQLAFLRHHQCLTYQGYFFSKPLPAEELQALVSKR